MYQSKEEFQSRYKEKFTELHGERLNEGTAWEQYEALVSLLRDEIRLLGAATNERYTKKRDKQIYYFSMEFLIGRLLDYYLMNLGLKEKVRSWLQEMGISLEALAENESDAGLGNGGLGRLAACFLDSMAFLGVPGHGNGIHYKYGLFRQKIVEACQVELPDNWLCKSYPWEIRRADRAVTVRFKGNVRSEPIDGKLRFIHENEEKVRAVPYDIPIVGYQNRNHIHNLRLWSAERSMDEDDYSALNLENLTKTAAGQSDVEAISSLLYPDDSSPEGRELRLKQEYFFAAAGLGSIVRRFKKKHGDVRDLAQKVSVHINDTHPALCIPELMRILIDEEGLEWEQAWTITVDTISFTNHTILSEALEKWPAEMFKYLLPRIFMIVEEIDRRYRDSLRSRYPEEGEIEQNTCIIHEGVIRMASLAILGSHSVNGVAPLHTKILKNDVFKDFYRARPDQFSNKTNGVSHRRFLLHGNPLLAQLISKAIGNGWITESSHLEKLRDFQKDDAFLSELAVIKHRNKEMLAQWIFEEQGIRIDPSSVFDVQVKRIHAYKRQLLNVLKIMDLYIRVRDGQSLEMPPQTFIFAGKAAPSYHFAKDIIRLINRLAEQINQDPRVNGLLKVVFLENFNVSLAERIYPAADISEQISTAGREASGTGNMKMMMNGAITLGTLDGANVEILQKAGRDNIMIFGLNADQVFDYHCHGGYQSWEAYHGDPRLKDVVDLLVTGFSAGTGSGFREIYDALLRDNDEYFVLKDFSSYLQAYEALNRLYTQRPIWNQMVLANIAGSGYFSSDRSVMEYADAIWNVSAEDHLA